MFEAYFERVLRTGFPAYGELTPSVSGPARSGHAGDLDGGRKRRVGELRVQDPGVFSTDGTWSVVKDLHGSGNTWAWDTTGLATGSYL